MSRPQKALEWSLNSKTRCLEVTSHQFNKGGYSRLKRDGKYTSAHRFVWEECFGPISDSLCICHKCDNPSCINPEHLFLGTNADNVKDMVLKGRNARHSCEERCRFAKLTFEEVREIRKRHQPRDRKNGTAVLAKEFGVAEETIRRLIHGKSWTVTPAPNKGHPCKATEKA
jgi:hypothetical protein